MEIFKAFQPQLKEGIEIKELVKLFVEDYSIEEEPKAFALENIEVIKEFKNKLTSLED
ncbi:MAG: hypothetical protein ACK5MQ_07435 [Pikeienuella sp.]